jgi:hypothetical protein
MILSLALKLMPGPPPLMTTVAFLPRLNLKLSGLVFKIASSFTYPKLQVPETPSALIWSRGFVPTVDYTVLSCAAEIDAAIRELRSPQAQIDFGDLVYLTYKQML